MNDQRTRVSTSTKRRRWQFSLGSLLLLIAVVSIWLGPRVNRANEQRRAVEAFNQLGLNIGYDFQRATSARGVGYSQLADVPGPDWLRKIVGDHYFQTVESVSSGFSKTGRVTDEHLVYVASCPDLLTLFVRETGISSEGLAHLSALGQLKTLVLTGNFSDSGLKHLSGLQSLESIDLSDNSLTGEGFKDLAELTSLRQLFLHGNPINDEGLRHIGQLTSIDMLGLSGSHVTDEGLRHLSSLRNLRYLGMSETKITDAGLAHLAALTSLQRLELGSGVTRDGKAALQKKLPNCDINGSLR